ncbi:hypothetical protein N7475_008597 [Penicillium sp. IBT 31633x]|nr:hypothetical protein N7475_008597 [Penicillium sp. IBT 31633x]
MSGRRPSVAFHAERANVWTSMEGIIHDLRHSYPASRNEIFGRVGLLFLQLSSYREAGESMGLSNPPNEIVQHAPPGFFTAEAQRHPNYFGTEFGYACWYTQSHLGYMTQDLLHERDPTRIADLLEELLATWQLIEIRAFPNPFPTRSQDSQPISVAQAPEAPILSPEVPEGSANLPVTPGSLETVNKTVRSTRPIRSSPRVRFILPAATNTIWGLARQRRRRPASPYPRRDHRGRISRRRPLRVAVEDDLLLPPILTNTDTSQLPAPSLPGLQSLFMPDIFPIGRTFPAVLSTSMESAVGIDIHAPFQPPAPSTCVSILNYNMGEALHGTRPLQARDAFSSRDSGRDDSESPVE